MLLKVDSLSLTYDTAAGPAPAVRRVSLTLEAGETLGIVGESGSGKSTLAYATIGYLAPGARLTGGRVLFGGDDLFALPPARLAALRGRRIAMVHQNPQSTLNPALRVGTQIAEVMRRHGGLSWRVARRRALDYLAMVNMPDPAEAARRYPHELSGGQRQRVAIAIALCMDPDLLIMDEPTTNLDVTTEAVILDLVGELKQRVGAAILYISHNLGVIARISDRVAVMYAGELVEQGPVARLFYRPTHPYTRDLLGCLPRPGLTKRSRTLAAIPGAVPRLTALPEGCSFAPRCAYAEVACRSSPPALEEVAPRHLVRCVRWQTVMATEAITRPSPAASVAKGEGEESLLHIRGLHKSFAGRGRFAPWSGTRPVRAVAGVDLDLPRHHVLGLVGESGSGKTTLLRCVAGLETADEGGIGFCGEDISRPVRHRPPRLLKQLQVVFQDPESTLNPKYTVGRNLLRHLKCLRRGRPTGSGDAARVALERVHLDPDYAARYPEELSGGEKQRVAIARAFLGEPELVLCDEPLSALDVSVQASILRLLLDLQKGTRVSYLLISHDLNVVRYIADKIAVMYLGRLLEIGPAETFDAPPYHPYTEALFSAVPLPDPDRSKRPIRLEGAIPSPSNPPRGCVFHTRCPRKLGSVCEEEVPPWQEVGSGRRYRCHIAPADLAMIQSAVGERPRERP